eukprot:6446440-Karenia_brevis.AAC.1
MTYDEHADNHNRKWKVGEEYLSVGEAAKLHATGRWGFGTTFVGRLKAEWNTTYQQWSNLFDDSFARQFFPQHSQVEC